MYAAGRLLTGKGSSSTSSHQKTTPIDRVEDPLYINQWNLRLINAPKAWSIATGAAPGAAVATVCTIDGGVDFQHPDLVDNIHPDFPTGYNAIHSTNTDGAKDKNGHGTFLAGIIGAATNNLDARFAADNEESPSYLGISGINWKSKIANCKFMDDVTGFGYVSDAIECLNWCVGTARAAVSSNAWGGAGYSIALQMAISGAGEQGHLFITSAGNNGVDLDIVKEFPAAYNLSNMVVVGASTENEQRCKTSNHGSFVQLYAPGCGYTGIYSLSVNGSYTWMEGTSPAAAQVAGAAALAHVAAGGKLPMTGGQNSIQSLLVNSARQFNFFTDVPRRLDLANVVAQAAQQAGLKRYG